MTRSKASKGSSRRLAQVCRRDLLLILGAGLLGLSVCPLGGVWTLSTRLGSVQTGASACHQSSTMRSKFSACPLSLRMMERSRVLTRRAGSLDGLGCKANTCRSRKISLTPTLNPPRRKAASRVSSSGAECLLVTADSHSQFGSKPRHFGRDAEIQAKDGNKPTDLSPS